MRKILIIIPVLAFILYACGNRTEENRNEDVEKLYNQTFRLTKLYTDSMSQATDSASLHGLMERFDARLSELNFSVKAETDYHLDEGKNDTIFLLIDSLRRTYDHRLYHLANPLPADSVAIDSSDN